MIIIIIIIIIVINDNHNNYKQTVKYERNATCNLKFCKKWQINQIHTMIHFQFWTYGSWDALFSHINASKCKLMCPEHYFNDKSAILLHPGTRWNKNVASQRQNLCAKDAGCAGNKITVYNDINNSILCWSMSS